MQSVSDIVVFCLVVYLMLFSCSKNFSVYREHVVQQHPNVWSSGSRPCWAESVSAFYDYNILTFCFYIVVHLVVSKKNLMLGDKRVSCWAISILWISLSLTIITVFGINLSGDICIINLRKLFGASEYERLSTVTTWLWAKKRTLPTYKPRVKRTNPKYFFVTLKKMPL